MPRAFLDDWAAGQVLTWTVVRGKCRYGPNHESVRDNGGEWWGESTRDVACPYAPEDPCRACGTTGFVEMSKAEAELAQYDGGRRPCTPCGGTGYVPGPHWPWRWPKPPPLKWES
jgi:hypothetical protein